MPDEKMVNKKEKQKDKIMSMIDYPMFSIKADYLPELKDWKLGKKYKLEMEVEMTRVAQHDSNSYEYETVEMDSKDNKGYIEGSFRVMPKSIKVV